MGLNPNVPFERLIPQLEERISDIKNFTEEERRSAQFIMSHINYFKEHGRLPVVPHPDDGFLINYRVAPKFFTGIILNPYLRDIIKKPNAWEIADRNESILIQQILNSYRGRENIIPPIYDPDGNLLWPKRMSYDEVKKFGAGRDKQKREEESQDKD